MIDRAAIDRAAARLGGAVRETPLLRLEPRTFGLDSPPVLKLELLQVTGSFKPRGAFNRMLAAAEAVPAAGVIAASGGNHGAAVAYAARRLGHKAEIYVPEAAPPAKVARIRGYGAEVRLVGASYAEAYAEMTARAQATGALVVHAYDQPEVVTGQGTVGREFAAQAPELDTVLIAVGGGGLIGGVAAWYAGSGTRVVGVEPRTSCALHAALAAGAPTDVEVAGIASDSLGARRVGEIMFAIAREAVAEVCLVEDADIRAAQRALWSEVQLIAEPGGAAALAALLAGAYRPAPGERVGVLVCGANTDPGTVTGSA